MPYFDVKEILSTAITIIDQHGFESSKTSKYPTWKRVDKYINEHTSFIRDDSVNSINVNITDESLKIIQWVKSLQCSTDYMSTVKQIIERGYCGKHLFGLLVSIIPIYREHIK